jgi:hypothetical protein
MLGRRSSSRPQCPKAAGRLRTACSRPPRRAKHGKKVIPLCPSTRTRPPDATPALSPLPPSLPSAVCYPLCPPARLRWFRTKPTAGVRGTITRFVTTIASPASTYHFYELAVSGLDADWLECKERRREWVDYAEAMRRLAWKQELAQGLGLSSLAPR